MSEGRRSYSIDLSSVGFFARTRSEVGSGYSIEELNDSGYWVRVGTTHTLISEARREMIEIALNRAAARKRAISNDMKRLLELCP